MRAITVAFSVCVGFGCSGELAKDATSAVVGKAVEVSKGTATGIVEGVQEGRKSAESADGAVIVMNKDELAKTGSASVGEITAAGENAQITVLFDNTGDKPARIGMIDPLALDTNGVVLDVVSQGPGQVTVPAKAKAKYQFTVKGKPESVKTVRVYGQDLPR